MGEQAPFYVFTAFVFAYGTGTLHVDRNFLLVALLTGALFSFFTIPFFGHLSDLLGRKRVYIAYTGGTIGMKRTRAGYVPASGFLQEQLRAMPELKHPSMPRFEVHEYAPLLDSSNMTPREWVAIARDIGDHYDDYDGFVVLHGTDTMAYTTSALPFMLHGLGKPVIVSGSQIPLCEVRNDGRENLITSLLIAANYDIPEVCLYFGGRLLRGCRAVKVSADGFAAFASPNVPPLGTVGIDIEINWDLVRKPRPRQKMRVEELASPVVSALRLFPGISPELVRNVLRLVDELPFGIYLVGWVSAMATGQDDRARLGDLAGGTRVVRKSALGEFHGGRFQGAPIVPS
jgi:L-asparaginase type I